MKKFSESMSPVFFCFHLIDLVKADPGSIVSFHLLPDCLVILGIYILERDEMFFWGLSLKRKLVKLHCTLVSAKKPKNWGILVLMTLVWSNVPPRTLDSSFSSYFHQHVQKWTNMYNTARRIRKSLGLNQNKKLAILISNLIFRHLHILYLLL